ncbi:hypothetical protein BpHYR1_004407 [Brachionus plicatilis]|uniref:Uncharacterized protein n=1 Tax=Brachionus plicatilis TaxID=10195 RepID=A0A3M7QMG8_BRAPC|nr:hypothetical protein BpHYR1_004407 [Brachionus plicatilis]
MNDIESGAAQWSKKTAVDQDGKLIWYHAEKAKYIERTNHTMETQERLIVHVEQGRKDAEARLRQTEDELNKAKETIRQLEDTVKSLQEVCCSSLNNYNTDSIQLMSIVSQCNTMISCAKQVIVYCARSGHLLIKFYNREPLDPNRSGKNYISLFNFLLYD